MEWSNRRGREADHQTRKNMTVGCVNVRGWGIEKYEDIGRVE